MDAKTLEALKGSIAKWDREEVEDYGVCNCPLCLLYYDSFLIACSDCPVYEKTRLFLCHETPYDKWRNHHNQKHDRDISPYSTQCPTCKEIQKEEADFLKSLLPKEEVNSSIFDEEKLKLAIGRYFLKHKEITMPIACDAELAREIIEANPVKSVKSVKSV